MSRLQPAPNNLIPLNFGEVLIRVIRRHDEPWWVAKDVCDVLGLANARQVVSDLDDDERGVHIVDTPGGPQEMAVISEPGLYALLARSRKPIARKFDRWVRHEVLPKIRREGGYSLNGGSNELLARIVRVAEQSQATMMMLGERSIHNEKKLDTVVGDVTELKGQVRDIQQRLPRIGKIKPSDRAWVIDMAAKMGGIDPLDPTKRLFDSAGRFTGQVDHIDGNPKNHKRNNLWPLEVRTHQRKTDGEFSLAEIRAASQSWHDKAKRLEPEQGILRLV